MKTLKQFLGLCDHTYVYFGKRFVYSLVFEPYTKLINRCTKCGKIKVVNV